MATCTLTLYKNTKLNDLKNFVIDDIETYLSSLSSDVVSNFQYQKLDLSMSIKLDKVQSYLLKSNTLNKYDYCKFSFTYNNVTRHYYYFIMRASWKAQETIGFELKMDTLNTYKLSGSASDDAYVLSNKSLITREHKDRMKYLEDRSSWKQREASAFDKTMVETWFDGSYVPGPLSPTITFTIAFDFESFMQIDTTGYTFPLRIVPHDDQVSIYILNTEDNEIIKEYSYSIVRYIDIYAGQIIIHYNVSDSDTYLFDDIKNTYTILFKVYMDADSGVTRTSFSPSATFNLIKPYFNDNFVYNYTTDHVYVRDIYQYQEGLSTFLFKKAEEVLIDEDGYNQWYVLYASVNAVVDNEYTNYVNPVKVRFYSDKGYEISARSSREVTLYATSPLIPKWKNTSEKIYALVKTQPASTGIAYVKVGGITYDFYYYEQVMVKRKNNNDITFEYVELYDRVNHEFTYPQHNFDSITYFGINTLSVDGTDYILNEYGKIQINSGDSTYSGTADKWEDLDLTDSRFIKAFAFPYCPCEFMVGVESFDHLPAAFTFSADDYIELSNIQKYEFKYQKRFKAKSPLHEINVLNPVIGEKKSRNVSYESKLFHSDYYQPKFVYDSFSFMFALENVDVQSVNDSYIGLDKYFYTTYIVSRNVQSKFAFIFDEYILTRATQDYDNILTIERNNEKALFNNSYINYMRSGGYSYDQKKASSQNAVNGISTALSIVGSAGALAGGFASANPVLLTAGVGLAVGGITGIMRSVHTAQEQDRAISQKLNQTILQGTSVQGSEDIDILTAFSNNKAKIVYYELSDIMKNAMWDLFHYCGYATHEQKVPDVTTRLYFNFVQGDIVFEEFTFGEDVADDIKNKWKQGVTFFHKVSGEYDIEQQYENFEVSLI